MSLGARAIAGKARARNSTACTAMVVTSGLASRAYIASTAWAMAFMPLDDPAETGSVRVNSGS